MKTAITSSVRAGSEFSERAEFLARGLASRDAARGTGIYYAAADVFADLAARVGLDFAPDKRSDNV